MTDTRRMALAKDVGVMAADKAMAMCMEETADLGMAIAAMAIAARSIEAFCDARMTLGIRQLADAPAGE